MANLTVISDYKISKRWFSNKLNVNFNCVYCQRSLAVKEEDVRKNVLNCSGCARSFMLCPLVGMQMKGIHHEAIAKKLDSEVRQRSADSSQRQRRDRLIKDGEYKQCRILQAKESENRALRIQEAERLSAYEAFVGGCKCLIFTSYKGCRSAYTKPFNMNISYRGFRNFQPCKINKTISVLEMHAPDAEDSFAYSFLYLDDGQLQDIMFWIKEFREDEDINNVLNDRIKDCGKFQDAFQSSMGSMMLRFRGQ